MNYFARTVADYQALVTSQYAYSTNFQALLGVFTAPICELQRLGVELLETISVENSVGNQLDWIGQWVGVGRLCVVTISGDFFTWNTTASEGWNAAPWVGDNDNTSYSITLDDDQYRIVINAKIYANQCGYKISDVYQILRILFPDDVDDMDVIDNQDMTMEIQYPAAMSSDNKAVLLSQIVPLKTSGVSITFVEI